MKRLNYSPSYVFSPFRCCSEIVFYCLTGVAGWLQRPFLAMASASPSSGIEPSLSEKMTFFFLKLPPPPEPVQLLDKGICWRAPSIECERSLRRSFSFWVESSTDGIELFTIHLYRIFYCNWIPSSTGSISDGEPSQHSSIWGFESSLSVTKRWTRSILESSDNCLPLINMPRMRRWVAIIVFQWWIRINDWFDVNLWLHTWAITVSVTILRNLFGKFEKDIVVIENGGKTSVDDLWWHGSIGQQQACSKILVLASFYMF